MPKITRSVSLILALLITPVVFAQHAAQQGTDHRFLLTVDSIMRGPDLVGYPPDGLRWSADSQKLYFEWRKPGEEEASTYVVGRDGGRFQHAHGNVGGLLARCLGGTGADGTGLTLDRFSLLFAHVTNLQ